MPSIIFNTHRNNLGIVAQGKLLPKFKDVIMIGITFCLTVFAWIFFRSASLEHAFLYITTMFSVSFFSVPTLMPYVLLLLLFIFMLIEWLGREEQFAIAKIGLKLPRAIKWGFYYALLFAIYYYAGSEQQFIYFQF
jgi:alginate O-acetyltransferase complex protein AlgI